MNRFLTGILLLCLSLLALAGCGSDSSSSPAVSSAPLSVKNNSLPVSTGGTPYSTFLGASGGKAPYTWSIVTGKLPSGMFLTPDGYVLGQSSSMGSYTVVFKVTDSSSPVQEAQVPLQINVSNLVNTPGSTGADLYAEHCAYCHYALGSANQQHTDATVAQVKAAIAADTGGMGEFGPSGIFTLSDADLAAIVAAIATPPVVTPTVPAVPASVVATAGQNQVSITWPPVSGATIYNIYWSTTSGVTVATGTKLTGVTSPYAHTSLTAGTPYYYVVTAQNATGESAASAQVTATPSATPVAPDGVALYNSKCQSCHGTLATSTKKGKTATQIQNAITGNAGGMGGLSTLTPAEVQAIATALQ
jgi:mono/diheme cytochrome c family protein